MAQVDVVHSPAGSMPGSYFGIDQDTFQKDHATYNSIYRPPAPSPRLKAAHKPSYNRSRSNRSISSIPRPVSRSGTEGEGVRKRPRLDDHSYSSTRSIPSALSTPHNESHGRHQHYQSCGLDGESEYDLSYFSAANSAYSRDALSPPPFVNTSYKLAGGLDTPGASFEKRNEEWADQQEEMDWRVNRYTKTKQPADTTPTAKKVGSRQQLPRTPSSTAGYGHKRSLADSPQFETPAETLSSDQNQYSASGWHIRSRAWAMTGGLAFKAINFCWTTAFGGFSAGGGQSYAMDIGTPEVPQRGFRVSQLAASEDVFSNQYEKKEEIPGGFPEDGFIKDHMSNTMQDLSTPTLQGQNDDGSFELKGDWLMVDRPSVTRRRSRASIAGSRSGSFRQSNTTRACVSSSTGASFASPRSRPNLSHSRRTSNNSVHQSPQRNRPSLSTNPAYDKEFSKLLPLTSPVRRQSEHAQSPSAMSPEVIKFEKRLRKKARENDESMSRMNAHLQDLIRQGKEALGSKISIEHNDDNDEEFNEEGSDDDQGHRQAGRPQAW